LTVWKPFECPIIDDAVSNMKAVLKECNLTVNDISMFCFSQYVIKTINEYRRRLGIDESKSLYIGDKYGYTGTSSPFIVLYEALQNGSVKRGDYVMFWTVGAGSENISMIFKY
jgi:3-oxoacyl-[acyl-carrier-protein] synthase-3